MASTKRPASPGLVPNPFIKKRNLDWTLELPDRDTPGLSLGVRTASPSPPPLARTRKSTATSSDTENPPSAAAIEAGRVQITDHLEHFTALLSRAVLIPYPLGTPQLAIQSYASLYASCTDSEHGAHFVIHQHDHPVAGLHYDLRLQISGTSSASWAIMYGLPGDANSARLARNATETRVHALWNHLVESASADSGSLLVWDTGTYAVLPRRGKHAPTVDPESESEREGEEEEVGGGGGGGSDDARGGAGPPTEQEKLRAAFANRKIRLRLDGSRLPRPYVVYLRLTKREDAAGRSRAMRTTAAAGPRRRRKGRERTTAQAGMKTNSSSDGSDSSAAEWQSDEDGGSREREEVTSAPEQGLDEDEDETVRRTNAYPGAANTIGSIHQRRWYLSLDRVASGFVERRAGGRTVWEQRQRPDGKTKKMAMEEEQEREGAQSSVVEAEGSRLSYPFYVRGSAHERSVVTGRLGRDILRDEGVTDFVGRKGWQPVLN